MNNLNIIESQRAKNVYVLVVKHNDLDNVGYTARHHTFLKCWVTFHFGDYFKAEAIEFAWEFLTQTLKINKDQLYVTVYHTDDYAFSTWKKVAGLNDSRIIRIDTNDNFGQWVVLGHVDHVLKYFMTMEVSMKEDTRFKTMMVIDILRFGI